MHFHLFYNFWKKSKQKHPSKQKCRNHIVLLLHIQYIYKYIHKYFTCTTTDKKKEKGK
uniref:Uncharacterized protein n=1 Tax=Anguilla anguilla TaxID=7936 RepID=A0A0E9UH87_ANGAN